MAEVLMGGDLLSLTQGGVSVSWELLEGELRNYLLGQSTITSMVGQRIYQVKIPQGGALPCVTLSRVSGSRVGILTGVSGLAHPRIQIDCWGTAYDSVKYLADRLRLCLDGFRGNFSSIQIQGCHLLGDFDAYDDESEVFHTALDFEIWHVEAKP